MDVAIRLLADARTARLRQLDGGDEEWLGRVDPEAPTATVVSELLARVVTALGDEAPPPREAIDGLLVGDRDWLLLQLRRLTQGDRFDIVAECPACGSPMDVEFEAGDVPVTRHEGAAGTHEITVHRIDGTAVTVKFRLPTGRDQEYAAEAGDPWEAMLESCLVSGTAAELDDAAIVELDTAMAGLAPAVELAMALECPECDRAFATDFDLAPLILSELSAAPGALLREVHEIARHYHWAEEAILGLSRRRRRAYLNLLREDALTTPGAG